VDLDEGYRLSATMGDSTRIRSALNAIANLYADPHVGRYDRAIEFYQQLLEAHRAAHDEKEVAAAYFNLGSTLERKGSLEQALAHYRRALAIDAGLGDPVEVATDRRAVAVVLYKLNRPAESLREIDRALAAFERAGEAESVAAARLTRGVALRMLGRNDEALADLDAARVRFRENPRYLEKVEEERALALAAAGRWPEAFAARGDQLALQRRLAEQAQEEQSARLRVQFDAQHREEENRALARANTLRGQALSAAARIRRLQRVVIVLSACIILVLVALVIRQIAGARRLSILALTDELTQLPNRRHVLLIAEEQFRAAQHGGGGYSLLMLDLDHFKEINDRYGHAVGDGVLRRVVDVSRQSLRAGDRMGRIGGEEFVAVLPGASASAAREVAERVRHAVEGAEVSDLHPELSRVTVSVGVAVWSPADHTFAGLLRRADDSLYQAKQRGRNRVVVDETTVPP
jgi:diguanylate cyclase (GGDEF)-like protein